MVVTEHSCAKCLASSMNMFMFSITSISLATFPNHQACSAVFMAS